MKVLNMSSSFFDSLTPDDKYKFRVEKFINSLSNFITECETQLTIEI